MMPSLALKVDSLLHIVWPNLLDSGTHRTIYSNIFETRDLVSLWYCKAPSSLSDRLKSIQPSEPGIMRSVCKTYVGDCFAVDS